MEISDLTQAEFYLQHLNYYRLGAYWLPFESDHTTHIFRSGTKFEEVLNLYLFDRELRLLMLDAIERVEVSIRSQWAYQIAHLHNPHGHLDATLAVNNSRWQKNLAKLTMEVNRSDENFIKHLITTYSEALPAA
jgi:abortive infection bacteriophage resistance protein